MNLEKPKIPKPPKHLSAKMKRFWRDLNGRFDFESQHLHLLRLACESYDRGQQAREILDAEGITYKDRFDSPKSRPEVQVERDARLSFARLIRELGIETDEADTERPPGLEALLNKRK